MVLVKHLVLIITARNVYTPCSKNKWPVKTSGLFFCYAVSVTPSYTRNNFLGRTKDLTQILILKMNEAMLAPRSLEARCLKKNNDNSISKMIIQSFKNSKKKQIHSMHRRVLHLSVYLSFCIHHGWKDILMKSRMYIQNYMYTHKKYQNFFRSKSIIPVKM